MAAWERIRRLLRPGSSGVYENEASVDLAIIDAHEQFSKLLIGVDRNRLDRRNKDRRSTSMTAFGDLVVEDGGLTWHPHRLEKTCGVKPIELEPGDVRSIDIEGTAVIAILKDGTNLPFMVNTRSAKQRRGFPWPRTGHQEPPLIS
jgi:hypothetical protein